MAKTFHLEIIGTDGIFFQGETEHLVITAIDGLLGVLPGHEPLVTALPTGELKYMIDGEWHYAAISEGFIQIMPDRAVLLADACGPPEEIAMRLADEERIRSEEVARQKQSIREYYETQANLNRTIRRLKESQKHFK